jgi:hypothetical protein
MPSGSGVVHWPGKVSMTIGAKAPGTAAEAATAAGYTAFNVLEGFEGMADGYGDRVVNGWKNRSLPWK